MRLFNKKSRISIRPSQKFGMDTPNSATIIAAVSFQVF